MKRKMLLVSLAIGCVATSLAATDAQDIRVDLPQELKQRTKPLSENEQKLAMSRASVNAKLPYVTRGDFALGSLGQLSKLCDNVLVGKVINIKDDHDKTSGKLLGLALSVETNLYGVISNKSITVNIRVQERDANPAKVGDRLLVFLADENYKKYIYDAIAFDFDRSLTKIATNNTSSVVCDGRGIFVFDTDVLERELLAATEGYLCVLRREKRSAVLYYALLRNLMLSPVSRIKEDARNDLLLLIVKDKSFDLRLLLADKNIDDGIKDYGRLILLPSRQPHSKQ